MYLAIGIDVMSKFKVVLHIFIVSLIIVLIGSCILGFTMGASAAVFSVLFSYGDPLENGYKCAIIGSLIGGLYSLGWSIHQAYIEW